MALRSCESSLAIAEYRFAAAGIDQKFLDRRQDDLRQQRVGLSPECVCWPQHPRGARDITTAAVRTTRVLRKGFLHGSHRHNNPEILAKTHQPCHTPLCPVWLWKVGGSAKLPAVIIPISRVTDSNFDPGKAVDVQADHCRSDACRMLGRAEPDWILWRLSLRLDVGFGFTGLCLLPPLDIAGAGESSSQVLL